MKRILLVSLGNVCRSPAAEGVLRAKARERGMNFYIDSAATGGWHTGDPPDARMIRAAARRGYDISYRRARQVELSDFYDFDFILAMDLRNQNELLSMAPPDRRCDIRLFLDFADSEPREALDPYYGGASEFQRTLDLVEQGVEGFLDYLEDESE